MKLKSFFLIIFLFFIITISRRLKTKRKKPVFELTWAVGEKFQNTDARHQFFDNGELVADKLEITDYTDYQTVIDKFIKPEFINRINYRIVEKDLTVKRIKIYSREFLFNTVHEFLMVCTVGEHAAYYFIIDRGSHKFLETKIRIIYTGYEQKETETDKDCKDDSKQWAEHRDDSYSKKQYSKLLNSHLLPDVDSKFCLPTKEQECEPLKFQTLIEATIEYAKKYPYYRLAGTNCQHFSTGIFNSVTGHSKEISNVNWAFRCDPKVHHDGIFDFVKSKTRSLKKEKL